MPLGKHGWYALPPVTDSKDLKRVEALPRRPRPDPDRLEAMVALMQARYARDNKRCRCALWKRKCITTLFPTQAWALYEISSKQGLLGPIGVGHGKTLLNVLAPLAMGVQLALLLVPANLRNQMRDEYRLYREHFRVPSIVIHGGPRFRAKSDTGVTLHVMSYASLSREESTAFLEDLAPDAIIADECHKLRDLSSVRSGRVVRYFASNPTTKFCGWTGSMTDSSVTDYSHLSAMSLKEGSPLPLKTSVADEWGGALDPNEDRADPGALEALCYPGEDVRAGFHRRLVETLGVVATQEPAVGAALFVRERPAPPIPREIARALRALREDWERPDGELLMTPLDVYRCARELACGFYYKWIFPRGESPALIKKWFKLRREWNAAVRQKLKTREPYMDSPALLERAAKRSWGDSDSEGPGWKHPAWPAWRDVKSEVKPETEAVRLSNYLVEDAAKWATENRGVVWYESEEFGKWVSEAAGIPLHAGGADAGERIKSEKGDRSIVASVKSHGTGRDGLQFLFSTQLVAQPPSSSASWEQLLGRLHRKGQESGCVTAWVYRHTEELRDAVDQAMRRAEYVEKTIGSKQKLKRGWR